MKCDAEPTHRHNGVRRSVDQQGMEGVFPIEEPNVYRRKTLSVTSELGPQSVLRYMKGGLRPINDHRDAADGIFRPALELQEDVVDAL